MPLALTNVPYSMRMIPSSSPALMVHQPQLALCEHHFCPVAPLCSGHPSYRESKGVKGGVVEVGEGIPGWVEVGRQLGGMAGGRSWAGPTDLTSART